MELNLSTALSMTLTPMQANCSNRDWSTSTENIIVSFIYIIVCVCGLSGNGLVLYLLIKRDRQGGGNRRRSVTNLFIMNLALADFIFVGALPFWVAEKLLEGRWIFGSIGCKFLSFLTLLNLYGSVFFLVAMSVDRYIAIVFALPSQKYRNPRNTIRACFAIWALACFIASQALFFRETEPFDCWERCMWNLEPYNLFDAYFVIRTSLGFFLPFAVILFCYIFIVITLKKQQDKIATHSKSKHRVTKMILLVISVFVICWLPNHIITLIYAVARNHDPELVSRIRPAFLISSCPAYANSCINPILYAFMKDDVKKRVLQTVANCFGMHSGVRRERGNIAQELVTLRKLQKRPKKSKKNDKILSPSPLLNPTLNTEL